VLRAEPDGGARDALVKGAQALAMVGADEAALERYAGADAEGFRIELVPFSTIESERTDWLWANRVPRGFLTLLVGTEGLGKSAVTLGLAAALTRGTLAGDFKGEPGDVALVTVEDDPAKTMRPRLDAAGADPDRIKYVRLTKQGEDEGVMFPRDAGRIGRELGEAGVRLVIVDPLAATLDPRLNSYKDTDVRQALTPLLAAARKHDFAVLGVLHTNKRSGTDARERAMGSVGWRQVVRSVLHLGVDPDDPDGKAGTGRAIAHDKCNVGRLARTMRVALAERTVDVGGRPATYPRAEFGEECDHNADDLLAAESGVSREGPTKATAAAGMLYGLLRDGPKAVSALKAEAEERGIGWRTVEDAKRTVGARAKQLAAGWVWELPDGLDI
jgi:hypothetical protein